MSAEAHLAKAFLQAHPARAAKVLEQMPLVRTHAVLREVPARLAASTIKEMTVSFASECLAQLATTGDAADIVDEMTVNEAAAVLRAMDDIPRGLVLADVHERQRDLVTQALFYPAGTAGEVMDPTVFHLPDDVLVADARSRLTRAARDLLYYVYIVDREQYLVGVLDIPELMQARARDPLSVAMHRDVERLNVLTPLAAVRQHTGWQRYHALPVVDERDRLVGAIRYQTLRRLEREAGERGPEPARVTTGALAELFQLGTSGLVAGLAATASRESDQGQAVAARTETPNAE